MLRLSTLPSRKATESLTLCPALRRTSMVRRCPRHFSTKIGDWRQKPSMKFLALSSFLKGSRSFGTERQFVEQATPISWRRLAITAAGVAGVFGIADGLLNRETRDSLSPAERSLLNDTFKYTGGALFLTALAARSFFNSRVGSRMMAANPFVVCGIGAIGSMGTMMGGLLTAPENTVQKHLFWLAFNGCQAVAFSTLFFFSPAILSRAALYTVGIVGSIAYVGATAKNDKYLYLGAPLLAGMTVVVLSSLAPMVLPMGLRALALSESISVYGGLALFGGSVLYDTQMILKRARMAEQGLMTPDPIMESIVLEMDILNIFIRMVTIFAMRDGKN